MTHCGVVAPERPELACERRGDGRWANHPEHTAIAFHGGNSMEFYDWPNEAYVTPEQKADPERRRKRVSNQKNKRFLKQMADRIKDDTWQGTDSVPSSSARS